MLLVPDVHASHRLREKLKNLFCWPGIQYREMETGSGREVRSASDALCWFSCSHCSNQHT